MTGLFDSNIFLWDTLLWAIAVVPVLVYFYRKEPGLCGNRMPDRRYVFCLFVIGMICSVGFRLVFDMLGIGSYEEETSALFEGDLWLQCLVLLIASPLWEELFFRGFLFVRLKKWVSLYGAVIFSAVCFGIYHGNLSQGIYAFFMGILLAAAMEKYKMVTAPVVIHVGANAASLLLKLVK